MSGRKNKKELTLLVSLTMLIFITFTGCNDLVTDDSCCETRSSYRGIESYSPSEYNEIRNEDDFVCAGKWLITLNREQSRQYELPHYERLVNNFVNQSGKKGIVELDELSRFVTENIGEYTIVEDFGGTRVYDVIIIIIRTPSGSCCIIIVRER